jgi:ABC-type transport system involved in multi-copper enzyme maturation permease subunit
MELRTASRRRRNYVLRVAYLGLLLLLLFWAWAVTREVWGVSGVAARQQQQEQLGFIFFVTFSMFSVIAMGLIGAVLTSTAINSERTHKTLHVLMMTPLTAWQIVSGKLFARLLAALTLIGLSLPVLAIVRLLGGVEVSQMFGVICMCAVVALTSAALGLMLSITVKRAYAVILMAYFLMGIAYLFVPAMMAYFLAAGGGRSGMRVMQMICAYNPFFCTGMLAGGGMRMLTVGWWPCVVAHLALPAVLLVLSAAMLRRQVRREGEAAGAAPPAQLAAVPDAAFPPPEPSTSAPPPRVRVGRTVSDHPVLWRELRRPLLAGRWARLVLLTVCLALLVISYCALGSNNDLHDSDSQIGYGIIFHSILMLLACVIAATAIAQEKEGDTWTVLLASPLSGRAIVWSKAIGAARRLLWPVVGVAVHFFVFVVGGVITPTTFLTLMTVIVTFNTIWIATGVALSLRCKKVTVAVIINLALPVMLYGALSLALVVVDQLLHVQGDLMEQMEWWVPYYWIISAADHGGYAGSYGYGSNWGPRMPGHESAHVSQEQFLVAALGVGLLHVGVAVAILSATAAQFNLIVGRAPQRDPLGHAFQPKLRLSSA